MKTLITILITAMILLALVYLPLHAQQNYSHRAQLEKYDPAVQQNYLRGAITSCAQIARQLDAAIADTFFYRYIDSNAPNGAVYDFIDIGHDSNMVAGGLDGFSGPLTIPFVFHFYGKDFTELVACSHGYLSTDPNEQSNDFTNDCPLPAIPSEGGGDRIYALHEELASDVYYQEFDVSPRWHDSGQELAAVIFQWNAKHATSNMTDPFRFQVIIYENSDIVIQIEAGDPLRGQSSTTGIQNADATSGLTYACNTIGYTENDVAIWILDEKLPEIITTPDSLTFFVFQGESKTQNLKVLNNGEVTMTYQVTPVSLDGNAVIDGSFEAGTPSPYWQEASTSFGSPICNGELCGYGNGSSTPSEGEYWAWFGGSYSYEEASLSQIVQIPISSNTLRFSLQLDFCSGDPNDFLEILIDGNQVYKIDAANDLCNWPGHQIQIIDITPYADNGVHTLEFHGITTSAQGVTSFAVDEVAISPNADWLSTDLDVDELPGGYDRDIQVMVNAINILIGPHRGGLQFTSNDPDKPSMIVPVYFEVVPPGADIAVNPLSHDFDECAPGETSDTLYLTLTNEGTDVIRLDSTILAGDNSEQFELVSAPTMPLVLIPSVTKTVKVVFKPNLPGNHSAKLIVFSNDPDEFEIAVELTGSAIPPSVEVTYNFPGQGWYLISLPLTPADNSLSSLFPFAIAAFEYNPVTRAYDAVSTLETKKGYWLVVPSPASATISGRQLTKYTEHYAEGWHLIGSVIENTDFSAPDDDPDGSILGAYGWDATTEQYFQVYPSGTGILETIQGYWIVVSTVCDLTIEGTAAPAICDAVVNYQLEMQPPAPPSATGLSKDRIQPVYKLATRNYPNPFNPETVIEYSLPKADFTQIVIYNALGQHIKTLVKEEKMPGTYRITGDGKDDFGELAPNGVYFYKINHGGIEQNRKILLIK